MSKKRPSEELPRSIASQRSANQREESKEIVTLREFIEMVKSRPSLAMPAHERVYEMIMSHGFEIYEEEGLSKKRYNLFKDDLFGLEDVIEEIVSYFRASALRLDTRKRILLLHGPVSGAKSTIAAILKRGLEKFSRTAAGELYALVWKDSLGMMQFAENLDDPLWALPESERARLLAEYDILVEGELSPQSHKEFQGLVEKFGGDMREVYDNVFCKRMYISEIDRTGLGTFVPSDTKSQEMSELIGSIDFNGIEEAGSESDPSAWRFDGELNRANRGIMEFIEMLKADERFLYVLLTLAQERLIKVPRFPLVSEDEVILAHTNETEYRKFVADSSREALMDRMIKIDVKYNLKVDEELKIYNKLMTREVKKISTHVAPHSFRVAAMFAILTRLASTDRCDLLAKMKLYNGQKVGEFSSGDIDEMKNAAPREGMDGVSPRMIINVLAESMIENEYVTPFVVLKKIHYCLKKSKFPKITSEKAAEYMELLDLVRQEYSRLASKDVFDSFISSWESTMQSMCENYLDHIEAYNNSAEFDDPVTQSKIPPDETLMRSIEDKMGNVNDSCREQFRASLIGVVGSVCRKGKAFDFKSDPRLRRAIEKQVFEDNRGSLRLSAFASNRMSEKQKEKNTEIKNHLISVLGYNDKSAIDVMAFVGGLLAKGEIDF